MRSNGCQREIKIKMNSFHEEKKTPKKRRKLNTGLMGQCFEKKMIEKYYQPWDQAEVRIV
jgi:hypothetical protein